MVTLTYQYTLPELMRLMSIVYAPGLATKMNELLNAKTEAEYRMRYGELNEQMHVSMHETSSEGTVNMPWFPDLPKFMPLTFLKVKGIDEDLLIESAIVSVSQTKNIVTTPIQGRDGTVKEFINNGDSVVNIRGMFSFKGMDWPREEVVLFKQYMKLGEPLKVTHDLLNKLDITELVVTDWNIPENTFVNLIPFTISCISEQVAEAKINEG